ncbi:OB-fold nucleic acid binding domain-containing protein [Candidatus Nanohalococcus occultus]|uniref:Single-stranded DNA-binding replication protein A (RPA), large (70 kD) subunit or related ssDNA-binding protein n=1 Tax=Candidatus Nanohalococcus occultus TaxID=2978047 RepID=A0ABY8CJB7_9ARCH|nr:Single-stranded DNA-binding replication protein A (RPA), large (70 kD) subunit or related ssDNA-binding protein [Candidatus Nanohaloarchaeota archaeon SVXNc]
MTEHTVENLTPEDDEVEITGKISELPKPRAVSTKYGQKKITVATFEDETGSIGLTLWEEEIDSINEGSNVKITGAYVREWGNDVQLNISRDGKIEAQ